MNRTLLKTICLVSGLGALALGLRIPAAMASALRGPNTAIIGGAGWPTFLFLLSHALRGPRGLLLAALFLAFLISGIVLITKGRKNHEEK